MGVVEMEAEHGRITRIVEKPTLEEAPSNLGSVPIYMFSQNLVKYLYQIQPSPRGEYELQDAIQNLIEKDGDVFGLLLRDRIDLTHPADLLRLNLKYLKNGPHKQEVLTEDIGEGTEFNTPVFIEHQVKIGANCRIGPNVFIESGASLADGVQLENCVVLRESEVQTDTQATDQVIW